MSANVQTNKNAEKSVKIPSRGIVGWKVLGPILRTVLRKLNIQFSMENIDVSETVQGLHLKSTGGGDGNHPFFMTGLGIFYFGQVDRITPTVNGEDIDTTPPPVLSISETDSPYLRIEKETIASNYSGDWRVIAGRTTDVSIIASSSEPVDTESEVDVVTGVTTDGIYHIRIAERVNGAWQYSVRNSLQTSVCGFDDGSTEFRTGVAS